MYNIEQKWYDVSQFDGKCLDQDGNAVTKGRKTIGLFRNKRLCFFVCIEQKRTPSLRGCEFDEKENRCYIYEGNFVLGKDKGSDGAGFSCAVLQAWAQEIGACVPERGQILNRYALLPTDLSTEFGPKECLELCQIKHNEDGVE